MGGRTHLMPWQPREAGKSNDLRAESEKVKTTVGRNDCASINIMAILIRHASTQLVDTTLTLVANRIVCETGDRQWRSKRQLGRISRSNDLRRKPSDSPE